MYTESIMTSFKEYLSESKKTYPFRVKVAGEIQKNLAARVKEALAKYDCKKVSVAKRTPIQETHMDFPELKNIEVNTFEIELNYPTTSFVLRNDLAERLNISQALIKVRNPMEEAEAEMNHAHMLAPGQGESLLEKDYETNADGQKLVGQDHVTSFLKELNKINAEHKAKIVKHEGKEEGGMSDPEFETPKEGRKSPLGAVKNPDPRQGKTK
jgi:hypothetical protein